MSNPATGPSSRTVTLGERTVVIERPSGRKVSRALALLKALSREVKGLTAAWQEAELAYEREHVDELDRAQARMEFPPRVMLDADGAPIREPDTLEGPDGPDGERIPNPRAGEFVLAPSPVDRITEAEWEASGHKLRLPRRAKARDLVPVILEQAIDQAEDHVVALLALFTMPNEQVAGVWRQGGDKFSEVLREEADRLLDTAFGDELLELAVVCGELVDDTFVRKAQDLGDRLGKAGRLLGLGKAQKAPSTPTSEEATQTEQEEEQTPPQTPTSTPPPEDSTSSSSSESEGPSDGSSTPPSTPPMTSSSSSAPSSEQRTPDDESSSAPAPAAATAT
jgi:hypothetical protein